LFDFQMEALIYGLHCLDRAVFAYWGAKNITTEKPSGLWLLTQVRRAAQDEQRVLFEWLRRKFEPESGGKSPEDKGN